jgi:hypothetical protein
VDRIERLASPDASVLEQDVHHRASLVLRRAIHKASEMRVRDISTIDRSGLGVVSSRVLARAPHSKLFQLAECAWALHTLLALGCCLRAPDRRPSRRSGLSRDLNSGRGCFEEAELLLRVGQLPVAFTNSAGRCEGCPLKKERAFCPSTQKGGSV